MNLKTVKWTKRIDFFFLGARLMTSLGVSPTMSKGWEDIFSKYKIEWATLPADSKLVHALSDNPAWETIYANSTAATQRQK